MIRHSLNCIVNELFNHIGSTTTTKQRELGLLDPSVSNGVGSGSTERTDSMTGSTDSLLSSFCRITNGSRVVNVMKKHYAVASQIQKITHGGSKNNIETNFEYLGASN